MPWVGNRSRAFVETYTPPPDTVLISITDVGRGQAILQDGYAAVHRVEFDDTTVPEAPNAMMLRHADGIATFIRYHPGKNILVHCEAGVSRSGGIVEAVLERYPDYRDDGWDRHPNAHVKALMKVALEK